MHSDSAGRLRGDRWASPLFSQSVLKHGLVQRQIGYQAFEPAVFALELLEAPDLGNPDARIDLLSAIERCLGNPHLAAILANGHSRPSLPQRKGKRSWCNDCKPPKKRGLYGCRAFAEAPPWTPATLARQKGRPSPRSGAAGPGMHGPTPKPTPSRIQDNGIGDVRKRLGGGHLVPVHDWL